ncbi:hypothetical protein WS81_08620 [Burkholderia sp. MSMB2040]|uniref:Uncharacterized protein n=1 Tax=Burkholderia savannae TaxID=1637837 RepID=A0ABR5T632_9BURK|nr:hypothetical protein WS78_24725 [Burkholderia savannae]KVG49675.1 hypothetical protein WS77_25660 [Burkholderia sp. MSMB0265]KVG82946.1 hypothetical protein WS81_08620 [Burkholderia sp. MSMB2040]KVG93464.1 hypothetical protein WS82_09675 [Burkholderia sp. MSMB2041]KWZ38654.1 hypothetical protein WS72_27955 [Burkholderia savannae]
MHVAVRDRSASRVREGVAFGASTTRGIYLLHTFRLRQSRDLGRNDSRSLKSIAKRIADAAGKPH